VVLRAEEQARSRLEPMGRGWAFEEEVPKRGGECLHQDPEVLVHL
jgi:hypothetical protein